MTEISFAHTEVADSHEAGKSLGRELIGGLLGLPVHAVIVFASSRYEPDILLKALKEECKGGIVIGCTSAGEFVTGALGTGSASALAISSAEIKFSSGIGRNIDKDPHRAVNELVSGFRGAGDYEFPFRSLLVLSDALAGQAEELTDMLNQATGGVYQIFGGGAGDDGKFESTQVFNGTDAHTRSMVALEICSKKPFGIGISHGWQPAGEPYRVTKSVGMKLMGLNASPALEVFQEHARMTGQTLDPANPLPFFLHNILGIDTGHGMKLRVPLTVEPDGSIVCAAEVPEGATIRIMSSTVASTTEAAKQAAQTAMRGLGDCKPKAAVFFDCVATRLKMGKEFGGELEALSSVIGRIPYVGCNTYGQIARVEGQFNGFHNCTAVVCVIPE
jgi:hypothetical protein